MTITRFNFEMQVIYFNCTHFILLIYIQKVLSRYIVSTYENTEIHKPCL